MVLLGLFVVVVLPGPSYAQSLHSDSDPAVTVPELEDLAEVMADPAARKMLLSRIRALIATRETPEAPPRSAGAGSRIIAVLSENMRETSRQLVAAADAVRDVPNLFVVLRDQATNPESR
jgi:hypothetical protein